ncbi:MAG: NADH-quinone oxidoreductase subunit NuoF [Candidatus Cloacimonetes bacterium]|nr:NADH-quinone oxidoreductase subunit NuoF [Candidatus Cloacimonadota bacterium]
MSKLTVKVGLASCGLAAGADAVYEEFKKNQAVQNGTIELKRTGCIGYCSMEPLVEFITDDKNVLYGSVEPQKVADLIESFLNSQELPGQTVLNSQKTGMEDNNFAKQKRIVLRNAGIIDPVSIDDYLARDGYKGLEKVLNEMSCEEVIGEIKKSGLRGRGGAGFPTGLKWQFARQSPGTKKYVICNADEGDPGAFMDRSILEGDPHSILEGMLIAAYAIGADEGYIYVRAEYPLAIKHLRIAIQDAEEKGCLGNNIMGKAFNFQIHIKEGAGAFVCGEETALMASIEGKRGMPNIRPPFPAQSGLWGKPTNINNVETYANVPWIIINGGEAFAAYGTEKSKGTKVFALAGKIKNSGLIEVPMGMTLKEVIYEVGGGMKTDKPFKAVQLGGPSGGCVPASLLDTLVDYDSINKTGAIMGSGGMVVMDESTCMVDVARFFLNFTQNESCGKCTFCRVGTKRMLEILTKICDGEGVVEDLQLLEDLAVNIINSSLCGLGQTAPNPVLTTIRYFKDEYLAHIEEKKCPAGVCLNLISYEIIPDKCIGCTVCARKCPVDAISGEVKKVHQIDIEKCIKCGVCLDSCKFAAIIKK